MCVWSGAVLMEKILKKLSSIRPVEKVKKLKFKGDFWKKTKSNKNRKKGFRHIPMGLQLWGSYIIIIFFIAIIMVVSYRGITNIIDEMYFVGKKQVPKIELLGHLREDVTRVAQ